VTATLRSTGVSLVLLIVAIILFILAALGVHALRDIDLVAAGLAFFAGSFVFA
jgi:hypothetical protein